MTGKVLQFVVNDANAVGSLDVLIGYNAASKYSMAAEVTTAELTGSVSADESINLAAEMYNGAYLKLDQGSVPKNSCGRRQVHLRQYCTDYYRCYNCI